MKNAIEQLEEFKKYALETARKLQESGSSPRIWTSDMGLSVAGWSLSYTESPREEIFSGTEYRGGSWGNRTTILTTDAEFWEFVFSGSETGGREGMETSLTNNLRKIGPGELFAEKNSFVPIKKKMDALLTRAYD